MSSRENNNVQSGLLASIYNPEYLLHQSRWIRDDLDLQVARDGPDALHSNDVLTLDEFLRRLLTSNISVDDIRTSRLHLTISAVAGHATRWPTKLIDKAEALKVAWEKQYGPLKKIKVPLYEKGGRLHGICGPEDITMESMLVKWLKNPGVKVSPLMARRRGDLGFKPGDWWISPLFALQAGIIDSAGPTGGVVADGEGAYAILMTSNEETNSSSPDSFTYRCKAHCRGRYRLTSATRESRQPIRILRSHTLRSFWAPKTGIRYDGLHKIAGWSIHNDPRTKHVVYEISFERLPSEIGMDVVLRRPFSDEIEDYKEYKRLRQIYRDQHRDAATIRAHAPILTVTTDGADDDCVEYWALMEALQDDPGDPTMVHHAEMIRHVIPFERSDSLVVV